MYTFIADFILSIVKMSDYEFENEEEEENETLGDKASWIGVANSTNKKFFLVAFMERTRETASGGWSRYDIMYIAKS